jgi:HlyD family secretion protein
MASYYTARDPLKPEELAKLGSAKLVPGMPVDVFIRVEPRCPI